MRNKESIIALGVVLIGGASAAILQKLLGNPMIFWIGSGVALLAGIFLFVYGLRLKPEKQIETSRGIFYIEKVHQEFFQSENKLLLVINVLFYAIPSRFVESLQLEFQNHPIDSGEQPGLVGGNVLTEGGEFKFYIPDSTPKGKYTVHLIAHSKGEKFEFNPFEIEIPESRIVKL